jgi:hypothetical protein
LRPSALLEKLAGKENTVVHLHIEMRIALPANFNPGTMATKRAWLFPARVKLTTTVLWLAGCGFIHAQTHESSPAIAPQYDTTHVYVAPADVDGFVRSFLGSFGGTSTKPVLVTVTPTPSQTTSQLLQTPVGTVSLFGFTTPIPAHFGDERNGYLVADMDSAIAAARKAGADIVVAPFRDPIGIDAIVQWPGGVNMQLYWHFKTPSYAPFRHVPENRIYVSANRADAFVQACLLSWQSDVG